MSFDIYSAYHLIYCHIRYFYIPNFKSAMRTKESDKKAYGALTKKHTKNVGIYY